MRSQFFPDIIVDNINLSIVWQGAGAEDVDAAIVEFWNQFYLALMV